MNCLWCGAPCWREVWITSFMSVGAHESCEADDHELWAATRFAQWRKGQDVQNTDREWRANLYRILQEESP